MSTEIITAIFAVLTPVVTYFVIQFVQGKLPSIPGKYIPLIAAVLGFAFQFVTESIGGVVSPVFGAILGMLAVVLDNLVKLFKGQPVVSSVKH